ncbi:hypothetical protein [Edaphobacter aggregans]|uniref:hypothetical protein n=1 Tax=Edaphobacter aggregans TaxID=570835 RepID=UPI00068BA0B9|nr:hypothetical protein [Edaphobacter aggregans]
MTTTRYAHLTGWLLAAWFALSLTASALHLFSVPPGRPPLPILIAVLAPLAIFSIWYLRSADLRGYLLSLSPRVLTLLHAWRIGGFVFLVLAAYNILPALFALPAGWGDIAIGVTAPFVAYRLATPAHKRTFIFWHILGITDLVLAVSLGALAPFLDPRQLAPNAVTPAPMSTLPLSLIPTFAVPLLLILHIISIAQTRHWAEGRSPNLREKLGPLTA